MAPKDTDGDGLTDAEERKLGTSTKLKDSDHDGLTDAAEVRLKTKPLERDSDGDGFNDGSEIAQHFDPLFKDPGHPYGFRDGQRKPTAADPDGDGLDDMSEGLSKTNPRDPDSDGDGIGDFEEFVRQTNPNSKFSQGPNDKTTDLDDVERELADMRAKRSGAGSGSGSGTKSSSLDDDQADVHLAAMAAPPSTTTAAPSSTTAPAVPRTPEELRAEANDFRSRSDAIHKAQADDVADRYRDEGGLRDDAARDAEAARHANKAALLQAAREHKNAEEYTKMAKDFAADAAKQRDPVIADEFREQGQGMQRLASAASERAARAERAAHDERGRADQLDRKVAEYEKSSSADLKFRPAEEVAESYERKSILLNQAADLRLKAETLRQDRDEVGATATSKLADAAEAQAAAIQPDLSKVDPGLLRAAGLATASDEPGTGVQTGGQVADATADAGQVLTSAEPAESPTAEDPLADAAANSSTSAAGSEQPVTTDPAYLTTDTVGDAYATADTLGGYDQPADTLGGYDQPADTLGGYDQPADTLGGYDQPADTDTYADAATGGSFDQPADTLGGYDQPATSDDGGYVEGSSADGMTAHSEPELSGYEPESDSYAMADDTSSYGTDEPAVYDDPSAYA